MTSATERLRELLAKATPGPWQIMCANEIIAADPSGEFDIALVAATYGGTDHAAIDNILIVEAVNALPGLLDTLDTLATLTAERLARRMGGEFVLHDDVGTRARELWALHMEASDGLAKLSVAAYIRSGALDDTPAFKAISAALRSADAPSDEGRVFTDDELEDFFSDEISDSIDMDWTSRIGAKAIVREMEKQGLSLGRLRADGPPVNKSSNIIRLLDDPRIAGSVDDQGRHAMAYGTDPLCHVCNRTYDICECRTVVDDAQGGVVREAAEAARKRIQHNIDHDCGSTGSVICDVVDLRAILALLAGGSER